MEITNPMELEPKNFGSYFRARKLNKVIRILTLVDVIVIGSFGLISPIFAIFIINSIKGGTVETAGIAMGVFLITKSLFQIPFGALIDKIKGEKDDFWALFAGYTIFSLVPLLYLTISTPTGLYIVEFIYGMAGALVVPAWCAIFTRHIDKNYEGIEWGVYQTLTDLSGGGTALLGGFLAYRFGFQSLFVLICICSLVGSFFLLWIKNKMRTGKLLF